MTPDSTALATKPFQSPSPQSSSPLIEQPNSDVNDSYLPPWAWSAGAALPEFVVAAIFSLVAAAENNDYFFIGTGVFIVLGFAVGYGTYECQFNQINQAQIQPAVPAGSDQSIV